MKLSDKLAKQVAEVETTTRPTTAAPKRTPATTEQPTARGKATTPRTRSSSRSVETARPATGESSTRFADAKRKVRDAVIRELAPRLSGPDAPTGAALEEEVTNLVDRMLRDEDVSVSVAERRSFVAAVLSDVLGYGPLDALLADPTVTEVMCNDFDEIWVEVGGIVTRSDVAFADREQYRTVIDKIVSAVGRRVDESSPMVDARLPDGSRVNAIVPPVAVHGPCLTIRRFAEDPYTAADLIGFGSMSDDLGVMLEACVRGGLNVLVSGGTATGKTTLLNVLSGFIPSHERIITIEDAAELQLQQPHVVTLESRPANAEGEGRIEIRDLVRNALRMRPDRIVVGECRGGEALDMLQAMNTGHDGSLTTLHANSPRDALSRLEMLVLMGGFELPERAIREMIAAAIQVVVQVTRLPDGSRKVTSVSEVHGMEDRTIVMQELFAYEPQLDGTGRYVGNAEPTGLRPRFLERLKGNGIELPAATFRREGTAPSRVNGSSRKAAR